jgi:cation/acetate symporter
VALLLDVKSHSGQSIVIAVVGILMIVYVLVGGMKGTTWVQIIKAVLLITGAALMTVMVLAKFGSIPPILVPAQSAAHRHRPSPSATILAPGAQYGGRSPRRSTSSRWRWRSCWAPRACRTC